MSEPIRNRRPRSTQNEQEVVTSSNDKAAGRALGQDTPSEGQRQTAHSGRDAGSTPAVASPPPASAALLADALRVSNAIYNGARNAAHDSPDMNMCSGCEWARLIDRLAAALRESEEREPFEKREYRAARRYILGRNGMSPFYDDGTIKNLTSLIVKLEDVVRVEAERASEAECERLQRELDVADVLAHEEIARLQAALAVATGQAKIVADLLDIGDQRLLASDGPAGNQKPDLTPSEWGKVYRACKKIAALNPEPST